MEVVFAWAFASLTPVGIVLIVLLFFPEKIEKWSAMLWKLLSYTGSVFQFAHKKYVQHDLQGRVNEFAKGLRSEVPGISSEKLRVEWIDPSTQRSTLVDKGQVVLRLRRDDPDDDNFVHGAYLFVTNALLRKPKRYLSKSQRDAVDLYVCTKLLEKERAAIVEIFLDKYLHPKTGDRKSKISAYVDDFASIDRGGMFFSLFLQELSYLGEKVFGRRRDPKIHVEVSGLVEFLKPIATRKVGDENDLNFSGEYCRFGIVIIGKPSKMLVSLDPYIHYIRRNLDAREVETIYILARAENEDRVDAIASVFEENYEYVRRLRFSRTLYYGDRTEKARQFLAVLRRRGVGVIVPSHRVETEYAE